MSSVNLIANVILIGLFHPGELEEDYSKMITT